HHGNAYFKDAAVASVEDYIVLGPTKDGSSITLFGTNKKEIRIGDYAHHRIYRFDEFVSLKLLPGNFLSPALSAVCFEAYTQFAKNLYKI
uniref:hypothetical protein n=1 Tax=Massilibacteroides sp. TaxID=2034766 RepID=UPI00260AE7E9